MGEQKNWTEIVLMPLVIALVGVIGTYLVTKQQQESALTMRDAQLASSRALAAADRQVKILEIFSEKITSDKKSQRILALRMLNAVDKDLAEKLATAVSELEQEKTEVRKVAKEVANAAVQARGHLIMELGLRPRSPARLKPGAKVKVAFRYDTIYPGGVRIWVRPFAGGTLAPRYAASGSPIYRSGQGDGISEFTIQQSGITVDQLRFQMWTADHSELLLERFTKVEYHFVD